MDSGCSPICSDRSRTWLLAHGDRALDEHQAAAWTTRLARLAAGEPLAYLLQRQAFFGLDLQVGPAVLVPRADTETLVGWGLEILRERTRDGAPTVVDLGCGSGAIALAIKSACPEAVLSAVDISEAALDLAAANGSRLGISVDWQRGDWWAGLGDSQFDLALSNPPYLASDDPHLGDLRHEPTLALVAAEDGLAALRAIVDTAPQHLKSSAWLLLEHGHQQADAVVRMLRSRGFEAVQTRLDLAGRTRCTGGRWA